MKWRNQREAISADSLVSQPCVGRVWVGERNLGVNSMKGKFQSLGTGEITQGECRWRKKEAKMKPSSGPKFKKFFHLFLFIHKFGAVLGLRCVRTLAVASGGYSLVAVHRPLTADISLVECRLWSARGSVVPARGSSSCGTRA